MATTIQRLSVTFTATNDAIDLQGQRLVVGMTFQGSGLTAGHLLRVRNKATVGQGSLLADYIIEGTPDNADLWAGRVPQMVAALSLDNTTLTGTWALTVFFGDGVEAP